MWYLLFVAILVVAGAIAAIVGENATERTLGWIVGLFLVVILTGYCSFHEVDAGHVGVVRTFGAITNQTGAGLVATKPWQDLDQATIQIQKYNDNNVTSASKETQNVYADVVVNYHVSPTAIQQLYTNVGPDYVNVLIPSRVNDFFKTETAKYAAVDVIPQREAIRTAVRDRLRSELQPYSINIDDLLIQNIHFDDAFTKAIEDKQNATQEAQAEQNRVAVAQAQGEQKAAAAKGDADAITTINSALAAAPDYINYLEANKFAQSWDGHLPQYVGSGAGNGILLPVQGSK